MRYVKYLSIVLLISWMAAGCGDNLGDYQPQPAIGEPFYLEFGEEADVLPAHLFLTFAAVETDSRCPTGVDCLWAGQVIVQVTGRLDDQSKVVRMGLGPDPATGTSFPAVITLFGHKVQLLEVLPYPDVNMDLPLSTDQYRIRLVVLD